MGTRCVWSVVFLMGFVTGVIAEDDSNVDVNKSIQGENAQVLEYSKLELVETFTHEGLGSPTSVAISPDGNFLYVSGYKPGGHVVFARDQATGSLSHLQTIENTSTLGATSLRLSADGELAVAAPFNSKKVLLYSRDAKSGKLSQIAQYPENETKSALSFSPEAQISFDNKFIYVLDIRGLAVFQIENKKDATTLKPVEFLTNPELSQSRGMVFHPSGKYAFVASKGANSLNALRRDEQTGRLALVDSKRDEEEGVSGLHSVFGVTVSVDGQFVYCVSGQHGYKDNSIGCFRFDMIKETLTLVQEQEPKDVLINGVAPKFAGGNEIILSPTGKHLFACATGSNSVAALELDAQTGEFTLKEVITSGPALGWVSGLAISQDGRFLYTASEKVNSVSIYRTTPLSE